MGFRRGHVTSTKRKTERSSWPHSQANTVEHLAVNLKQNPWQAGQVGETRGAAAAATTSGAAAVAAHRRR